MLMTPAPQAGPSLMLIEGGLTTIAIAVAFAWPRLGANWFTGVERMFARLARKQGLAVFAVGLATLLLRLAILPIVPIPLPFVPDDFSFLLAADTFAQVAWLTPPQSCGPTSKASTSPCSPPI